MRPGGAGSRAGATTRWTSAVRPSGAVACNAWTPGGSCSAEARVSPCSVSMRSAGAVRQRGQFRGQCGRPSTPPSAAAAAPASRASRAARAAPTASGVLASTPSAARTATTAPSEAATVRSGDGL